MKARVNLTVWNIPLVFGTIIAALYVIDPARFADASLLYILLTALVIGMYVGMSLMTLAGAVLAQVTGVK